MNMMITGLVLVTLGAVLRYAVDSDWDALDVPVVGLILMCVGVVAFVVGTLQTFMLRDQGRLARQPQLPPVPAPTPPPAVLPGGQVPPASQASVPPSNPPQP